jgi:aspartyl-tRNA(Asn)/glutamyl-tRNA(Gln) amidotransferase subunit C
MAQPPPIDIDYVAQLARLALTEEEKATFSRQLGDILGYVAQLQEVNVDGIEPTAHALPLENVWSADEPVPALPREDALRNAPATRDGMFVVPKVVE